MLREQMTLEEVYRFRDLIEQAGKCIYYYSQKSSQWFKLHFTASQELMAGSNYPVLIERQDGQMMRSYMKKTEVVRVTSQQELPTASPDIPVRHPDRRPVRGMAHR
jgi:hypothetical protein